MTSRKNSAALAVNCRASADRLRQLTRLRPALAVILGSGFGHVIERIRVVAEVSYAELPGFSKPGVSGHHGRIFLGCLGGTPVCLLSGRTHFYEGHSMEEVTFPVRVLAQFGVRDLLLTNAAGGINRRFRAGDFMRLTDHINWMGTNPLRSPAGPGSECFVDMTGAYDERLAALLVAAARRIKVRLRSGVYLAVCGPSYETPAEIRAFSRLGADAVGMSTVPETIVARQCGIAVAGLSCITNLAAGRGAARLSHAEVLSTGGRVKQTAAGLIEEFAKLYADRR
jgi:purine-nucleoside phosphorylase